jgi:hypothetical protein
VHMTKGELAQWVIALCFVLFLLFGADWLTT